VKKRGSGAGRVGCFTVGKHASSNGDRVRHISRGTSKQEGGGHRERVLTRIVGHALGAA